MAIQQNQTHQRILKVKKSESSLGQVDQKNVKITVPSSKRDKTSMSDLSKHSHETDSIPRKKISRTIPGPLVKAHKVTQEEYDLDKDNKVISSVEGTKQTSVRVSPHPLLSTPPQFEQSNWQTGLVCAVVVVFPFELQQQEPAGCSQRNSSVLNLILT